MRHDNRSKSGKSGPLLEKDVFQREMDRQMEAGTVTQMMDGAGNIRYVNNTPQAIAIKKGQGWSEVEYETETVKKAVPKKKAAAAKKKAK